MTEPRRSLTYRPELDGIRAVAVMLVVVFHVWQPHRFSGFIGVDVFFVLSGYLITTILLREIGRTGSLRFGRFYWRRMLRLYPALLFTVICSFAFYRDLSGTLVHHIKNAAVALTYTSNLYMTYRHHFIDGFAHTWSLALEEQYYLVWPVVLFLLIRSGLRRRWLACLLAAAAVIACAFNVHDFHYGASSYPLQSTTMGLFAGSALAVALKSSAAPSVRRWFSVRWVALLGVALIGAELVVFSLTSAVPAGAYSPVAVLGTVLIVGYLSSVGPNRLAAMLSLAPLVYVGRISYGVYLYHYPILRIISAHTSASPWVIAPIEIVLTLAIAALSYRFVETPFLRLKDRGASGGTRPVSKAAESSQPVVDPAAR